MLLSIAYDRLRWEEKALKDQADAMGVTASMVDAKSFLLEVTRKDGPALGDVMLQRCISHYRGLFLSRIVEASGLQVVNRFSVAETCGNKLATTMALVRAGVPTPRTLVALSSESVMQAAEALGFPLVLKPFTGSWGRLVSVVRDRATLGAMVELREELPNPLDHLYYLQEYVQRPPRDIRAVVAGAELAACVHRYAPDGEWRTNVARGGRSEAFEPDPALRELIFKAAEAVGGGILGVDAMESREGYLVHEVNSTVEFRGAQSAVGWSIPEKILHYVIGSAKK